MYSSPLGGGPESCILTKYNHYSPAFYTSLVNGTVLAVIHEVVRSSSHYNKKPALSAPTTAIP